MTFTEDDARSLAAKLDALDLSEGERVALDAVFVAASGDDVSGFAPAPGRPLELAAGLPRPTYLATVTGLLEHELTHRRIT